MNNEVENAVVVAMAEEALAIHGNIGRDYWMGGEKGGDGTWRWRSGAPMDFTNWCEGCLDHPDVKDWNCLQLLRDGYPGTLDTFYWARQICLNSVDNGVICEIDMEK